MDLGEEFEALWESTGERLAKRRSWSELTLSEKKRRSSEYRRALREYSETGFQAQMTEEFGLPPTSKEPGSPHGETPGRGV